MLQVEMQRGISVGVLCTLRELEDLAYSLIATLAFLPWRSPRLTVLITDSRQTEPLRDVVEIPARPCCNSDVGRGAWLRRDERRLVSVAVHSRYFGTGYLTDTRNGGFDEISARKWLLALCRADNLARMLLLDADEICFGSQPGWLDVLRDEPDIGSLVTTHATGPGLSGYLEEVNPHPRLFTGKILSRLYWKENPQLPDEEPNRTRHCVLACSTGGRSPKARALPELTHLNVNRISPALRERCRHVEVPSRFLYELYNDIARRDTAIADGYQALRKVIQSAQAHFARR